MFVCDGWFVGPDVGGTERSAGQDGDVPRQSGERRKGLFIGQLLL